MTPSRAISLMALAAGVGVAFLAMPRARAQEPRGKAVYERHCVECHGPAGRGDGASAAFLAPRPRDFTTGKYKIRTHIKPVRHQTPEPVPGNGVTIPGAIEQDYGGKDYGK